METPQIVLDTNIIYSALRSRRGASYKILSLIDSDKYILNLSVPLLLEYEDVLKRNSQLLKLSNYQIEQFLDYLCFKSRLHEVYFLWRPILKDPKDDMILELSVRAECDFIVTYNSQDFEGIHKFGIRLLTPKELLTYLEDIG